MIKQGRSEEPEIHSDMNTRKQILYKKLILDKKFVLINLLSFSFLCLDKRQLWKIMKGKFESHPFIVEIHSMIESLAKNLYYYHVTWKLLSCYIEITIMLH